LGNAGRVARIDPQVSAAVYRGMDRATLDAAYNNRAAVPRYGAISEERRIRSEELRRSLTFDADLRYGERPRQRLDFFPASGAAPAPVFVFIHGGYWQMNDKEPSTFLVEGPRARGFSVALVEYTLAPEAELDTIVKEVASALDWLAASKLGPGQRLYVAGHSAGGHLAAMMLGHRAVAGVLAISGLFDLEPIRLCYLNEKLRLTPDAARRNSPRLHLPKQAPALAISVGAEELPELVRQSSEYADALRAAGLAARYLPLAGHDHFTVLDELARPRGRLCEALCELREAA